MSLINDVMLDASKIVNSVLGVICDYTDSKGNETSQIDIVINRNKPLKDDFGMIAGFRCEAAILKSDLCKIKNGDTFIDTDGNVKWKINQIMKETPSKWYVDIIEIPQ